MNAHILHNISHKIDEPSDSMASQGRVRGWGGGRAGERGSRCGSASRRVRGRRSCSPVSTISWSATTPENDQAPPAQPFSWSPGPITDLPDDSQPIHFFEQVDPDILQLIVTVTNMCIENAG